MRKSKKTYSTKAYPKKRYLDRQPMRIQARKDSPAERAYYKRSALPGVVWPMPKAIAPGIGPEPLEDLMFHGGRVMPDMEFQNIYLGEAADWVQSDIENIDEGITLAMRDRRLNNMMAQYFPGRTLTCDPRESFVLNAPKPRQMDEPDVHAMVIELFDNDPRLKKTDLGTMLFNLVLPPGTVLRLRESSSLNGLGGYHGSVHIRRNNRPVTLYYSANVFSEILPSGRQNGIAVFDRPWKNLVGTLYHELNEFRTDPDVLDAINNGSNDFLGWTSRTGRECGDQPIFVAEPLNLVFKEVSAGSQNKRVPVQFMYSNAVHGAEGPIDEPH
jgi:hypothetical protein